MDTKGNMNKQDAVIGGDIDELMKSSNEMVSQDEMAEDLEENMSDIDAMLRELNLDMRSGRHVPEHEEVDLSASQEEEFGEVSIEDMLEDVEIRDRSKQEDALSQYEAELESIADAIPAEDPKEKKRREKLARKQAKKEAKASKKSKKQGDAEGGKNADVDAESENTDGQEELSKAGGLKGLFNKLTEDVDEEEEQERAKDDGSSDDVDKNAPDPAEAAKKAAAQKKKAKADQKAKAKKEKEKKAAEKNKAKAKAKAAKAKAAKKPEKPKVEEKPGKRLKKGSVLIICVFAVSVLGMILFVNMLLSPILQKGGAEEAFEEKDYVSCYRLLAGMKLSDEEMKMQQHAEVVLKISGRIVSYEYYRNASGELEALDCLMAAVEEYDGLYQQAVGCGAENEVREIYARILSILAEEYGISEDTAKQIATCESDVEYTRYLVDLISGEKSQGLPGINVSPRTDDSPETETDAPDTLPEEQEMQDVNFSD